MKMCTGFWGGGVGVLIMINLINQYHTIIILSIVPQLAQITKKHNNYYDYDINTLSILEYLVRVQSHIPTHQLHTLLLFSPDFVEYDPLESQKHFKPLTL